MTVRVDEPERELAAARLLQDHPEGFEVAPDGFAVYTDAAGEETLRAEFAVVTAEAVEPGWEDRWREFHQPSWVGEIWIGPPWEEPPPDALSVVVDPGRAFGTGSHATTRLCLELLQELPRGSLLDVGCGSGVLSIGGAKLGYQPVVSLDRDPAAIEATLRNAAANEVALDVRAVDAVTEDLPAAEVTVANIDLASVERLAERLETRVLVTAGYFHSRTPRLEGFGHVERRIDGGWAADLWERK